MIVEQNEIIMKNQVSTGYGDENSLRASKSMEKKNEYMNNGNVNAVIVKRSI